MIPRKKFIRAACGLKRVMRADTSIRLHMSIGIAVLLLAWVIRLNRLEIVLLVGTVCFVITLEGINTILERVIDLVEPRFKEMVREIKDALAGLVLFASIGAAVIGVLIFWPYIAHAVK